MKVKLNAGVAVVLYRSSE